MESDVSSPAKKDTDAPAVSTLQKALTSESFIEKTTLLLLTAMLSGIVIPFVMTSLQTKRTKEEAVLSSQVKLLDDVSTTILTYETLAADVSWFKHPDAKNDEMHEIAFKRYNERAVDLIAQWRALAAKSQTLVSPLVSQKINEFLKRMFLEQDTPMMRLHRDKASDEDWKIQHTKNEKMIGEANDLVAEIADDMNISKTALAHGTYRAR